MVCSITSGLWAARGEKKKETERKREIRRGTVDGLQGLQGPCFGVGRLDDSGIIDVKKKKKRIVETE